MEKTKFRAWLKNEKRMVKVLSIDFQNKEIGFAPIEIDIDAFSKIEDYYAVLETKKFDEIELIQFIGQYDDNDKEIYEEDIIEYSYGCNCKRKAIVKYDSYNLKFVISVDNEPSVLDFEELYKIAQKIKVIGNIYENPELLEEKEI